jgi:hypothetical protein
VTEPISLALGVDIPIVVLTLAIALRFGRLGHSHPLTAYFVFHILVVTFRLVSLHLGSDTLFAGPLWRKLLYEPVSHAEILRASLIADVGLVVFTAASLWACRRERLTRGATPQRFRPLQLRYIQAVAAFAFPVGVVGLILMATVPGLQAGSPDLGDWQGSGWLVITQTWAGLALLGLIYWYGFRRVLILPIALYLLVMMYQGFHRFRVVIPLLLMCQIYLDRHDLKWPSLRISAALLLTTLLFFPLKTIGRMAQEGASIDEIAQESRSVIKSVFASEGEMQLLDEFASGVTLMDDAQRRDYGGSYLTLLTLPIPRQWWPSKPGLADYLADISTRKRPMSEMGMVVSYLGEAYLNLGYVGVLIMPWLAGYALSRAYFMVYTLPYLSVARFAYLLVACNLIQVYRDGLISVVVFTLVHMMPLMVIVALHYLIPARRAVPLRAIARPQSISRNRREARLRPTARVRSIG